MLNIRTKIMTGAASATMLGSIFNPGALAVVDVHSPHDTSWSDKINAVIERQLDTAYMRKSASRESNHVTSSHDENRSSYTSVTTSTHHNSNGLSAHYKFKSNLTGSEEVPGPGDPDGTGHAKVTLWLSSGLVCHNIHVRNIDTPTAAHIHKGAKGEAGPVVVTLSTPNALGFSISCSKVDDKELLNNIANNPSFYYINVHTSLFPNGAVRGQL